jgi:hypothetical protein
MLRRAIFSTVSVIAAFLPVVFGFQTQAHAEISQASASRPKGVSAELFINKALEQTNSLRSDKSSKGLGTGPVVWAKSSFEAATWSRVPAMSASDLEASFGMVREEKFFTDEAARKRRATWLYPDDGCFVRATVADELIAKLLQAAAVPTAKIFAFGNLQVQTANSPSGAVEWWYHVAAISKVSVATSDGTQDEYFVFDPAINPKAPMPVKAWLSTMGDPNIEIAICAGGAYDPSSRCEDNDPSVRQFAIERAYGEAQQFLPAEWERLEQLARDPHLELGSNPPW